MQPGIISAIGLHFGSCPHPVTSYNKGNISGYNMNIIQLVLGDRGV